MRYPFLQRAKPLLKSMAIYMVTVIAIIAGLGSQIFTDASNLTAPAISRNKISNEHNPVPLINSLSNFSWKELLYTNIPGLKTLDNIATESDWDPANFLLFLLTGEKINDPLYCLKTEVPVMAMVPLEQDSIDEKDPDSITEPPQPKVNNNRPPIENNITSSEPLVAFYCTHSSETYELSEGVTHLKGKSGAVLDVAKKLSREIEDKYSIPTLLNDAIHDLSYNKSYVESQKTVQKLVAENKSLEMLFDIHRDSSLPRDRTVTTIKGKNYAKVLIIVGTDARASHPKWKENLAFARDLAAKVDGLYPGLSRGISVKKGRYNQQHHSGALLLEIGSINNTKEEAMNSASLMADIIVDLLNEKRDKVN